MLMAISVHLRLWSRWTAALKPNPDSSMVSLTYFPLWDNSVYYTVRRVSTLRRQYTRATDVWDEFRVVLHAYCRDAYGNRPGDSSLFHS